MPAVQPSVPIEVDSETGIWTTDGMPMIYMPRHFFLNHHLVIENALGRARYGELLYEAGFESAWEWCAREAVKHQLRGTAVFRHYMKRISQRGWGQFTIERLDEASGTAVIRLDHSVYVEGQRASLGRPLCYPFAGWFPGALEWAGRDLGYAWHLESQEARCAGDGAHDHCAFEVRPRAGGSAPLK